MTLKEKFMKLIGIPFKDKGVYIDINKVEECEKIADDYAIEFVGWFVLRYTEAVFYRENYIADLLEEFKKEKEL